MQDILYEHNIKHAEYNDLDGEGTGFLLPDKGDRKEFDYFLQERNIDFDFRKIRDNKLPDMLLKIKNDIFIIEHKFTNGGGGSQNAELNEIIQFVNHSEKDSKVHFVSCLQGDYFKKLNSNNKEPKARTQYENIVGALSKNLNNFFVNGKGLKKLVADFVLLI